MKKCQSCAEEVQSDAKVCKHCSAKQKRIYSQKEKIIITAILATFLIIIISPFGDDEKEKVVVENQSATKSQAHIISQSFVKAVLKSPSTAEFPTLDYEAMDFGNGKYQITSYVDSQNGFGAEIRGNYSAVLSHNKGDWTNVNNWILHKLIFNGELVYDDEKEG